MEFKALTKSPLNSGLSVSDEDWLALIETMDYGIGQIDADGTIMFCNRALAATLGYSPEELIHKVIWDLIPTDREKNLLQNIFDQSIPRFSTSSSRAIRIRTKTKIMIDVQVNGHRITDPHRRTQKIIFTLNMAQKKQALSPQRQKELLDNETRLDIALRSSGTGTWFWDLDKNHITPDNFTLDILGLKPDTFSGKLEDLMLLCKPSDRRALAEALERTLTSHADLDIKFQIQHPQTATRTLNLRGQIHDDDRTTADQMVGICLDITHQIKAEQAQQEHKNLQNAIESMQNVLGVVGHELRTPLAALRVTSEYLLTEGAWQQDNTDQFLNSIHTEVIRLSEMVNNMLEAARVNSGAASWKWETVHLDPLCQDVIGIVTPLIDQDNVELEFHLNPPDLQCMGDHDAILRLLINLITNSAKSTSTGSITVMARPLKKNKCSWIEIMVQDTGCGISETVVKKLGQAFILNSGMIGSDYTKGAGLGLSICKGIVAAHGGSIAVSSRMEEGTTFKILLRADLTGPLLTGKSVEIINERDNP